MAYPTPVAEDARPSALVRLSRAIARAGLIVGLIPVCIIGVIVHYIIPMDPAKRRRASLIWNLAVVAGFVWCIWYWMTVRRGYGVAAAVMLLNLQIADVYATLVPKLSAKAGVAMLFALGWFVAIYQVTKYYPINTGRNMVAVTLLAIMIVVYAIATLVVFMPEHKSD